MKSLKNKLILLLGFVISLILLVSAVKPAIPRPQLDPSGFTIARGPAPDAGDIYNAYWHKDRTGIYMVTFFDSSASTTLYHIRWFAVTDSAVSHLDDDWSGRDTLSYQEYPLELQFLSLE